MADTLGRKALKGTFWAAVDRFGVMGLQFIVNLVLARLLTPYDFGLVGVLAIFISVAQTLVESGFASALIQKKEPTQTDYSTVFYWNLALALGLYAIVWFTSPWVATFFHMPELRSVFRGLGLYVIFSSLSIVQINRLRKQLAFHHLALVNVGSLVMAGALAITAAINGLGVWSLVILQVANGLLVSGLLWGTTRWRPSATFSKQSFRGLFHFGGYLFASSLLQEFCKNFQGIIIGRWFSAVQMGYYSQAQKLDQVTSYSLSQIIVQVMFPVYSAIQDDMKRLQELLAMNLRVIAFVVFPLLGLLILVAEPLIVGLYEAKWLPAVPYFRILCVGGMFVCLQNVNFYVVASRGASKALFHWSFYKWTMLLVLLFAGMPLGMKGIMWAMVVSAFNIYLVNAFLARKYSGLSMKRQMGSWLPIFLVVGVSLAAAYASLKWLHMDYIRGMAIFLVSYVIIIGVGKFKVMGDIRNLKEMMFRKTYRTDNINEKN